MTKRGFLFFLAAIAFKIVLFAWMAHFGFPRTTEDVIVFQQPAYMYHFSGVFTIPTADGRLPYAREVYGAYPPGYTLVSLGVISLFGFTMKSMLWMDIAIHLLTSILFSVVLMVLVENGYVAGLFLLSSSFLIVPRGRPDELAVLLILVAAINSFRKGFALLSGLVLGLAFLCQPVIGLVGLLVLAWISYEQSGSLHQTLSLFSLFVVTSMVCAGILWVLFLFPHVSQGYMQFLAHTRLRYSPNFWQMLTHSPTWGAVFVATFIASTSGALVVWRKLGVSGKLVPRQFSAIKSLALCLPMLVVVQLALCSPSYSFRLISYYSLAGSFLVLSLLLQSGKWSIKRSIVTPMLILVTVLVLANNEVIRYILLPFTWADQNSGYQKAQETVRRQVPTGSMVGGDPILWWTITDGRPYYSLGWYAGDTLPDYILSSTFWGAGGETDVLMWPGWASRIRESYEEVTPEAGVTAPARLTFGSLVIPISTSSAADWRIRIWKKKGYQP